jgi:hypothetical protein
MVQIEYDLVLNCFYLEQQYSTRNGLMMNYL